MKKTYKDLTKGYYYINSSITEENFPIPKELSIEGYKIIIIKMDKSFSSQKGLDRIKSEGFRPATIWEVALLKQEHPELWPKGKWSHLIALGSIWKDADGDFRVPFVGASTDGGFRFDLDDFGGNWVAGCCLIAFATSPHDPLTLVPDTSKEVQEAITLLKNAGFTITKQIITTKEY